MVQQEGQAVPRIQCSISSTCSWIGQAAQGDECIGRGVMRADDATCSVLAMPSPQSYCTGPLIRITCTLHRCCCPGVYLLSQGGMPRCPALMMACVRLVSVALAGRGQKTGAATAGSSCCCISCKRCWCSAIWKLSEASASSWGAWQGKRMGRRCQCLEL